MPDSDLAVLYGVQIKMLNRAVRRNLWRFPGDFMLTLTKVESAALRCQIGTLDRGRGQHRKHPVLAFSEQGVAMLSSVLRSRRAIEVNIEIMRAFVRLGHFLSTHQDLAGKLAALERRHEHKFEIVFEAIRQLSTPETPKRRKIGFETG